MVPLRSLTVERLIVVGRILVPTNTAARSQPRPRPPSAYREESGGDSLELLRVFKDLLDP